MSESRQWLTIRSSQVSRGWLGRLRSVPEIVLSAAVRREIESPIVQEAVSVLATRPTIGPAESVVLADPDGAISIPHAVSNAPSARDTGGKQTGRGTSRSPGIDRDVTKTTNQPETPTEFEGDIRERLLRALTLSTDLLLSPDGPLDWPQPLLPFQDTGARELIERSSLLLADDMGLGKTIQAISALRVLVVQRRITRTLLVVPAGLVTQWRRELNRWAPELRISTVHGSISDRTWQWRTPAHVYLTSYETLRSDFTENERHPVAREWDLVVLDEAQKIKNADTDVSHVCKRVRRRRQWALTGTPLENRIDDLYSILAFIQPDAAPRGQRFVTPGDLRAVLGSIQLRRRKADVLPDLPAKLISHVQLPLTPAQRKSYDRAEQQGIIELRSRGEQLRIQNVLELIVRLKQICNFCPETGESSKFDDVRERVETLQTEGHKALIFSQFANAENGVRAIARRLGPDTLIYTGDQSRDERDDVLRRFRAQPDQTTLVLSLLAGGQGLNLQEASYVFHFDRWWNPAVQAQAESRSHRMGQQFPVNVYSYTCENTIEERIGDILREKRQLFEDIVDDVSLDLASTLSSSELFGLFGLRAPSGSEQA